MGGEEEKRSVGNLLDRPIFIRPSFFFGGVIVFLFLFYLGAEFGLARVWREINYIYM